VIKALNRLKNSLISEGHVNESQKIDSIIKNAGKKKKALYTAAFLTDAAKIELKNWWRLKTKGELLQNEFAHHMTIKFKPSPDEVLAMPIGEPVTLTVIGYAEDESGQAVLVIPNGVISSNDIPHVTVSTADGVRPVYSNELLARGVEEVRDGPELGAIVGFHNGKEIRYDFDGSIYE